MNEPSPFDPAALERLCRLGGDKFAVQMIDLYFSFGGKKLDEARQAWQAGDLAALAEAAHALKSTAGNAGAVRVQAVAAQVEAAARERTSELAGAQFSELERAFAEARPILELEQTKLAKTPS